LFLAILLLPASILPALAAEVKQDTPERAAPIQAELEKYIEECAPRYSEEHRMLGQKFNSPGYHTTVASGTWVHPVLPSLDYALGLLQRNRPEDRQRAERILKKVIRLQDSDANSRTYGIWPWLLEEPLAKMSPPDWNWADFCGARLALILADHVEGVADDLEQSVRASLGHAAKAIRKRNVGANYTNIAIMGGGVCAAAGELLDDPEMLKYGRKRLQQVVSHTALHGSFNEYNSPTYTMVALLESERTLHLVRDPATREAAESIRKTAWQVIAESFHPGTSQWAGPHARSYSDYLFPKVAAYLSEQSGVVIPLHPSVDATRSADLPVSWHLPCPEPLKDRFRRLPADPSEIRRRFIRGATADSSIIGTTWFTADACLGSVNRGTFWTQCRPLIGYWKTEGDPAVVLRLRFLHDGRDFASMGVRIAQAGGRALAIVYPLAGQGDWHPGLDRPANGIFQASDFRLRIELHGKGVALEKIGAERWALRAGQRRAVVHTLPGRFAGQPIAWQSAEGKDVVHADAVCYHGPKRDFDFRRLPDVVLAAGLEIITAAEPPSDSSPRLRQPNPRLAEALWDVGGGLRIDAPVAAAKGE
jgi:hypothetical protein